ncbi:MAG: extracellular solute-binding protein, partial [Bacilli bacterium]
AWLQMMKEKAGWDYMKKLHNNIALYTHSGSKPSKLAAAGEYAIGISLVYSGVQRMQDGAPVKVVLAKEGIGWDVEANALINKKDKAKDKLAKAFLDWAITDDPMEKYYNANGFTTLKKSFKPIPNFPNNVVKMMYPKNDLYWAAKNRDRILKTWDKNFGAKSEPK